MDVNEVKLIITNSPPFNKLKKRHLNNLIDISQAKVYKNGDIIYSQGGPADYLYLLLKGRAMALTKTGIKDSEIEVLKRGTFFGIISLFTDDPHSVTVRSIETSYVLEIEKGEFKKFLNKNPALSLDFSRLLSQRVKSRYKPKRIFQSKKIAIFGNDTSGKSTYMLNLGAQLAKETRKDVICVQAISGKEESLIMLEGLCPLEKCKDKILLLKEFHEEAVTSCIIKGGIDCLFVQAQTGAGFSSLLNFLSEEYHFILYEVSDELLGESMSSFARPAHQIQLIIKPRLAQLKEANTLIRDLCSVTSENGEKIKVILAEFLEKRIIPSDKKKKILDLEIYATIPDYQKEDFPKAIRRIARQLGEVTLGLALGSGGAYGFSHIGVFEVLEKNNVDIDIICGSSAGALVASLWALGYDMQDAKRICTEFGKSIKIFSIGGISLPFKGLMKAKRLEDSFKRIFGYANFSDVKHTLKIVTFDFLKRKTVVIDKGPIYKAVAASCAFPGFFEPIKHEAGIFLDGGILNPLPTKVLLNFDAHRIIASNTALSTEQALREYRKRDKFHIFDFIFGSIGTMQQEFIQQSIKIADVVIHPNLEGLDWTEFDKVPEFVERGRAAAEERIEDIKKLINF